MKTITYIFGFLFLVACSSQKETSNANHVQKNNFQANSVETTQAEIPLSVYLSRIAGVNVRGTGADAIVLIRSGSNSLTSSSEPLFLINGNQFSGSFSTLSQMIPVNEIRSVVVYKNASETSMYGVRGANGVIDIKLKTATNN